MIWEERKQAQKLLTTHFADSQSTVIIRLVRSSITMAKLTVAGTKTQEIPFRIHLK